MSLEAWFIYSTTKLTDFYFGINFKLIFLAVPEKKGPDRKQRLYIRVLFFLAEVRNPKNLQVDAQKAKPRPFQFVINLMSNVQWSNGRYFRNGNYSVSTLGLDIASLVLWWIFEVIWSFGTSWCFHLISNFAVKYPVESEEQCL